MGFLTEMDLMPTQNERVLLIDRLPNPDITGKGSTIGRNVSGMNVANIGLVRSLLKYGTFDRYLFIQENPNLEKLEKYEDRKRLQPVHLGNAQSLAGIDNLVLFTTSHHLAKYVPVRQLFQRPDWPICGLAHGLSPSFLMPQHVWNRLSAVQSNDAVICTSECQRLDMQAIDRAFFESACLAVRPKSDGRPSYPVIPLGVELDTVPAHCEFSSKSRDSKFIILTIVRFSVESKVDLRPFIAGFLRSHDLPDDSVFIIAGDDPDGAATRELQSFAAQFDAKRQVRILSSAAANRRELLAVADAALCLSDNVGESFGLFLLEAMFSGLPVVAPSWNGFRELVEHGRTGFLAPTCFMDNTELLSALSLLIDPAYILSQRVIIDVPMIMGYLAQLAHNPQLRRDLGSEARKVALNKYTWEKIVPRYEALWEEQIARGHHYRYAKLKGSCNFYDYGQIFGHKATTRIHPDSVIVPSKPGQGWLQNGALLFSPHQTAGFDSEMYGLILEIVERRSFVTVQQIVEEMEASNHQRQQVLTQIAQLLKYDLLCVNSEKKSPLQIDKLNGVKVSPEQELCS
jgi:glycosyltransferase involved in cell wall biosynthesis